MFFKKVIAGLLSSFIVVFSLVVFIGLIYKGVSSFFSLMQSAFSIEYRAAAFICFGVSLLLTGCVLVLDEKGKNNNDTDKSN